METLRPAAQRSQRLREIAQELGAILNEDTSQLSLSIQCPTFRVPQDEPEADALLANIRLEEAASQQQSNGLKRAFSSKKQSSYTDKELRTAITRIIDQNGSAGVAEVILGRLRSLGGDPNVSRRASHSLFRIGKKADRDEQRIRILQTAVELQRLDFVQLLRPPVVDQTGLDESLPIAFGRRFSDITELLIRYGANPAVCRDLFQAAVAHGDADMISILLRSPMQLGLQCLSESLLPAVISRSVRTVLLLVHAGADGDYQGGSALMRAIETAQLEMAIAIVSGPNPPSGRTLDLAITAVFSEPAVNLNEKLMVIDILLCGGPEGNAANEGLIIATRMGCIPMMQLLLEARASINYDTASAVRHAICRSRKDWVEVLLQNQKLNPEIASEAVREIDRKAPSEVKVAMASILLTQGASGYHTNELLARAVESDDLILAELLVTHRASVDYNGAKSLALAVSRDNAAMVAVLLQGEPSKFSLSTAFQSIPKGIQADRHRMAKVLLEAGAQGPEVDFALRDAITFQDQPIQFIELLVDHEADVNGETFLKAVSQGCFPVVKILLKGHPTSKTISAAIPVALKLQHNTTRYQVLKAIIREAVAADAGKAEIAQALIDTVQHRPGDEPLLRLLCREGKADINYNDGQALILAAGWESPSVLDIILQIGGRVANMATITNALATAMPLPVTEYRRRKIEILLRGEKPQKAIDGALIQEICWALSTPRDLSVIQTLLVAGADVNASNGAPVCHAVRNSDILDMILVRHPTAQSLSMAFPLAMALVDVEARLVVCEKLLKAGAVGEEISKALCNASKEVPSDLRLIQLILPQADVNYSDGRAVRMVIRRKQLESLSLLLKQRPNMATRLRGMQEAMKISTREDRYLAVKVLLEAGTKGELLSDALAVAVNSRDLELAELFIKSGASVEYQGAQSIVSAASSGDKDILRLLVGGFGSEKPSLSAITSGFGAALALKEKDKNSYHDVIEILLGAGMKGTAVDAALIEEVKEGDSNLKTIEMIYRCGANVEFQEGEAIDIAARCGFVETLQLLLASNPSQNVLKRAFRSATNLGKDQRYTVIELIMKAKKCIDKHVTNVFLRATQESPADRRFIKLLLDFDVFDEGQSMTHAASIHDFETLALLLESPKASQFVSTTFQDVVALGGCCQTPKGLALAELMLEKGATGDSTGEALVAAVEQYCDDTTNTVASDLLDLLFRYKVDVNYQRGLALQRAAKKANWDVLTKLMVGATSQSKCMAFPYLFKSTVTVDESTILQMIDVFTDSSDADSTLDIEFTHPDPQIEPVLFMALSKFPRKTRILKALLDSGLNPHQMMLHELDPEIGKEQVNILIWALDQPQKKISNENIFLLIDAGVDINFSSRSRITPVMLAINNQRPDVLERLIEKGVKVTIADEHGVTPLAIASKLGNAEVMGQLLKAGAEIDDGSLHDAARELRLDAMRVLMQYDHDPDFPSDRHEGRSALAELCLHATDNGNLEEAVEYLLAKGSKISLRHAGGKTIFHYALDSSNPLPILRVLLKLTWKYINDEAFLYAAGPYTYSLTMYVSKDLFLGPKIHKAEILRLLRNKRAEDRFWATNITDPQPSDLIGAPKDVMDEVRRQQARSKRLADEHQDMLHRNKLKQLSFIADEDILAQQAHSQNRREYETSKARQQLRENEAKQSMNLNAAAEAESQRHLRMRQALEMEHMKALGYEQVRTQKAIAEAKIEVESTSRLLQLEYIEERMQKENEGVRQRLAIEASDRDEAERTQGRLHDKEMARLRMKKEMMGGMQRLAGGMQAAGANQRQIGYVLGEVR